jgi:hypothetical protein
MHEIAALNQRGLFAGPHEAEADFFERVKNLEVLPSVRLEQFDAFPDWIEMKVGSEGLSFWEGAATWVEENSLGVRSCQIQVKHSFLTQLYPMQELVEHEMVHAMRLMFDEERFEEILAYQTSKNRFRRYFGPLFSSPKAAKQLISSIFLSWGIYVAEVVFDFPVFEEFIFFAPAFVLGAYLLKLVKSQRVFATALRQLAKVVSKGASPLFVLLRLTDKEIEQFAKSTPEEIAAFAKGQQSLRWKQICLSYF